MREGAVRAEQITPSVAYHGEGPVWADAWGGLRWVDMLAGDILTLADDGTVARRHVASVVAALRPRRGGGAVIAVERGFVLEDVDGAMHELTELWSEPTRRMNEGGCDPEGRFYCGSMAYDRRPGGGALYRLDAALTVEVILPKVTISNGIAWSPDHARAYYADTATLRVDVFDYEPDRGLFGRRPFLVFEDPRERPDGLTVDSEGGVWIAMNGAASVRRVDDRARQDAHIELPVTKVTACTFGGPDLGTLYVTTSREDLAADEEPAAGALFACQPGARGLPALPFAG
jgi:sugar lactone lactonase YvrE